MHFIQIAYSICLFVIYLMNEYITAIPNFSLTLQISIRWAPVEEHKWHANTHPEKYIFNDWAVLLICKPPTGSIYVYKRLKQTRPIIIEETLVYIYIYIIYIYIIKGSDMIVCVLLVSNSQWCCLAAPGDDEGAANNYLFGDKCWGNDFDIVYTVD